MLRRANTVLFDVLIIDVCHAIYSECQTCITEPFLIQAVWDSTHNIQKIQVSVHLVALRRHSGEPNRYDKVHVLISARSTPAVTNLLPILRADNPELRDAFGTTKI